MVDFCFQSEISNTNNDYVYGRPNGTSVSISMACNRGTPYDERTFITLVQNGKQSQKHNVYNYKGNIEIHIFRTEHTLFK